AMFSIGFAKFLKFSKPNFFVIWSKQRRSEPRV
ncbi:MAG: hypothetical protein ACI9VN_003858, partial [Patescibacteria group bacterium]